MILTDCGGKGIHMKREGRIGVTCRSWDGSEEVEELEGSGVGVWYFNHSESA